MLCVPVTASTLAGAIEEAGSIGPDAADLIELRLDLIRERLDLPALLAAARLPVIATCRPVREGGSYEGDEAERLRLLEAAEAAGAAYVDLEGEAVTRFRSAGRAQRIVSYHNFTETPADLEATVRSLEALPGEIVKFATHATKLTDNLRAWECLARRTKPTIGLCMGELGEASRVLALWKGSYLTFGSLGRGRESAPGQLTAHDLRSLYRIGRITDATRLYAVVGDPVAHSMSPEIHNTAFRALGLDACYLRFRVDGFAEFLRDFEPLRLQGLSVTIPHKDAARRASAEVEPLAEKIGAVNTLTRLPNGGWRGENTDLQASREAIRQAAARAQVTLEGAPALLLGAGGAARGIAYALLELGCRLVVANRTRERAEALARETGGITVDPGAAREGTYAVVANATSIGMHPETGESPVDRRVFRPGMVAFDAVYNPRRTRMLEEARAAGAQIADGVEMFVGQAARQFELWTGQPAPRGEMERIVLQRLGHAD